MNEIAMFFRNSVVSPLWSGLTTLWNDVLYPFGEAVYNWAAGHPGWLFQLPDLCFSFFKLQYTVRVISWMLMIPAGAFLLIKLLFGKKRRIRKRRR